MRAYRQVKSSLAWFVPESEGDRQKRLDSAAQVWYYHYIERMRSRKEKTMSPSNGNETTTLKIQRTVFDLETFDDVKLVKEITAPAPVQSIEDALAAVNNDKAALLAVINDGLREKARESAYSDITGFQSLDENGEPSGNDYSGKFADDSKTKLINAGVLNMAKMYAGGAWDSLPKEKKAEFKNQARDLIRSTPAMLQSLVG